MTKSLYLVVYFFFLAPPFAFVLPFAFEQQTDKALRFFGYDNNFVSSFPFIRSLYFHLTSARWIGPLDVGYFHLLDAIVWGSIFVFGTWLLATLVYLKQYDDFFQQRFLAPGGQGQPRAPLLAWVAALLLPYGITYLSIQDKIVRDAEIVFLIKHLTGIYFYVFAIAYHYDGALVALFTVFVAWRLFRQKWPGVVLWREDLDGEARAS